MRAIQDNLTMRKGAPAVLEAFGRERADGCWTARADRDGVSHSEIRSAAGTGDRSRLRSGLHAIYACSGLDRILIDYFGNGPVLSIIASHTSRAIFASKIGRVPQNEAALLGAATDRTQTSDL